jgi:hypothetical protein
MTTGGSTADLGVVQDSAVREATFTVVYDGPALADHLIDVRHLAPSLLALSTLVDEANRTCNGDRAKVSLAVKATHPGCFEVQMHIVQTLLQQAQGLFASDAVTAAVNLQNLIFGTGGVVSLFGLIKWLNGRQPIDAKRDGDNIHIQIDASTHVTIDKNVYMLYENQRAREAAFDVVHPLDDEGIEVFRVRDGATVIQEVLRSERDAFVPPLKNELATEDLLDETYKKALTVVAPDFNEGNKWRMSDGSQEFYVSMRDDDFNGRVERGEVSFAKGDVLICQMRSRQTRTGVKLFTEYEAIRVLDHKKSATQTSFGKGF